MFIFNKTQKHFLVAQNRPNFWWSFTPYKMQSINLG